MTQVSTDETTFKSNLRTTSEEWSIFLSYANPLLSRIHVKVRSNDSGQVIAIEPISEPKTPIPTIYQMGPCKIGEYRLASSIQVLLERIEETWIATFLDADIASGGESPSEAIDNLKTYMVELYESFDDPEEKLAALPKRQLEFLQLLLKHGD